MLTIDHLEVCFGNLKILWDVCLHVNEGEIVALVGANAAGKTTTLKSIAGLIKKTKGELVFNGTDLSQLAAYRIVEEGVCLIPEGRRLFPEMTVRENLELGAYGRKVWVERQQNLEYVYQVFPALKEREKRLAKTLSGGEQQMVAVGRGLMSKPRLCMLDEPSLGLSPLNVRELFRIIQVLRDHGTTILLVEQNVQQTLTIANRAYVLENGKIVLEGTGAELMNNNHVRTAYLGA